MASRKIQVHRVEESSTPKGQISGLDNPAHRDQDTVRSMAELMCNESPMAQDEVPPSPSVPVPSIPPPPPEKVNGALPRVETIEEEDEEELDIEEEARRMGVDAGEIAMIASHGSIRRMSSISKISYIEKTKKKYPLKITVTTGVLFIIMVIGVSLIFHFYHKQLYLLEIGAQIKFDEITRHIDFRGEDEVIKMSGNLGLEIPNEVKFLDCSMDNTRKTHLCLTWKGHAQLWIDYSNHDNVDCYKIAWWGKKYDTILKDCYEIGDASWYGGGFLSKKQMWTLNNISVPETLFVTGSDEKSGQLGSVLARYWLNSNAISIFAPSYYPLFFSFNELDNKTEQGNGKFCLVSHSLDRFGGQRRKEYPEMNYTVCVSNDINSVQTYSLNKTLRDQNKTPRKLPNEKLFKNTVWSTKKLSNLSEESLIQFGSDITAINYSHGFLILNSKWEKYLGDLNFNAQIFPGASAMLRSLQSNFTLSLSLTPYIDTRSEAFQHDIHDKLLIEDAGGVAPGLIEYLNPMFNQSLIAGVIKVESPYFHAKLREIKNFYNIESIVLKGGDVRTLPFGADHGAHLESNMNWFTQKYSDAVNGTYSTLFVESASQTQWLLPIVVMPSLPSTWDGLRTVLPRMFTLGIIGYPLVLPEVVGGSINDADEYQPSKELYIRWLELSAFLPVMHFSDFPHSYDSTTTQISRKFVQFHSEQIAPLVLRLAQQSVSRLEPIIRPLWRIAPQDKEIFTIEDQFLVGDEMLVAPVLDNTKQRNIYLPEGSWFDKLKNKFYTGPRWLRDYNVELDEVAYFMWQSQ